MPSAGNGRNLRRGVEKPRDAGKRRLAGGAREDPMRLRTDTGTRRGKFGKVPFDGRGGFGRRQKGRRFARAWTTGDVS